MGQRVVTHDPSISIRGYTVTAHVHARYLCLINVNQ